MAKELSKEEIIANLNSRIEEHKKIIEVLENARDIILNPRKPIHGVPIEQNPKLTKEFARTWLKKWNRPVQTKQMINAFFLAADEETKTKAIKTLSVIFNTLVKDGQVKMEKQKGVKGNFYTWIGD
ncbi:MAG: hypothetical protein C5B52_08235 [Bacteroidetes bacterium]|nr:MAG: hypothetical protein C5B52_08235 [Bacteroidota bacterium]